MARRLTRLVLRLTDGREFAGEYPLPCALARLEYAQALPEFAGFVLEVGR